MPTVLASDTTDLVSAVGAAVGGGATVVAAAAAVAAAFVAVRTLRATKRDSRDRSRPMVGAELVIDPQLSARTASLVVRNFGPSVAYNVKVEFDPPLAEQPTHSGQPSIIAFLLKRYADPIPTFMPGNELFNIYFIGKEDPDDPDRSIRNDEQIPDRVTVTITYGSAPNERDTYSDTFVLDMSVHRWGTFSTHSDSLHSLQKRSTQALEKIAPAMAHLATDIGRIEEYLKPEKIRAQQAVEKIEECRQMRELSRQMLGDRSPYADEDGEERHATNPLNSNALRSPGDDSVPDGIRSLQDLRALARTIRISSRPDPTEIAAATTADTSAATPYTDLGGINDTDPDPAGRQKP